MFPSRGSDGSRLDGHVRVRVALSSNTPCSAQRVKLPVGGASVPISALISLKILTKEGGKGTPSLTEKQSPCACPGPWYGSWPIITTFTLSKGHKLKALNINFPGGYMAYLPYSSRTKLLMCKSNLCQIQAANVLSSYLRSERS